VARDGLKELLRQGEALTVGDLDLELLDAERGRLEAPSDFAATLNVRGLYNTMQFVLRLSPRIHQLIDSVPNGIYDSGALGPEIIQAYSTYLHETVHWWQHMGSTAGLVLSLSYPGQLHVSLAHLRTVLSEVGPKKSLKRWAEIAALSSVGPPSNALGTGRRPGHGRAGDIQLRPHKPASSSDVFAFCRIFTRQV
jgi:hypothetical protein